MMRLICVTHARLEPAYHHPKTSIGGTPNAKTYRYHGIQKMVSDHIDAQNLFEDLKSYTAQQAEAHVWLHSPRCHMVWL